MFTVTVAEKGGEQRRLEFDEDVITIGRVHDNEVVLPRGNVSKQHARLELRGGEFRLTDLNSTNGTYINGRRITETALVSPGDKVYIGEFIVGLELPSGARDSGTATYPTPNTEDFEEAATDAPADPAPEPGGTKKFGDPLAPPEQAVPDDDLAEVPDPEISDVFSSVSPAVAAVHASAPPSVPAPFAAPRRISAPPPPPPRSGSATPVSPTSGHRTEGLSSVAHELRVEQLIEMVSRQVKRIELGQIPMRLDEGSSGKVRIVLAEAIDELIAQGKIPPTDEAARLFGAAFRAIVDLGPLGSWLDDPEIKEIRISRADAILLRRASGWSPAVPGFVSEDALTESLRCLGAGVLGRDEGGVPGLVRYRIEDGALVLAALPPAASSGSSASIYKNLSPRIRDAAGYAPRFDGEMREALDSAVARKARIAIVGSALPYRLSVAADIVHLVPAAELLVGAEDLPLLGFGGSGRLGISAHALRKGETRAAGLGALLPRAVDLHPDWIVACGSWWEDVPELLACAAGRNGFVAELPLSAEHGLDKELSLGLTAAGLSISASRAAELWADAFDIIAVADVSPEGDPVIARLLAPHVDGTAWAPRLLCERRATKLR